MNTLKTFAAIVLLGSGIGTAQAFDRGLLGALIGGGGGAFIGSELGGETGAVIGAGLGAAGGVALAGHHHSDRRHHVSHRRPSYYVPASYDERPHYSHHRYRHFERDDY